MRTAPVADRRGLQAVQLVQCAADRGVGDEVERIFALVRLPLRLVDKRAASREAVVYVPDQLRVAERLPAEFGRQHHGEFAEVS